MIQLRSGSGADPRSVGFPPGHPVMHSLLAVPVAHGAAVVGNLYLADKVGAREFSPEDERLLRLLAGEAAGRDRKGRPAREAAGPRRLPQSKPPSEHAP